MGMQLVGFFNQAEKLGGLSARMKLAMVTRISATQAEALPDSGELVTRFTAALEDIKQANRRQGIPGALVSAPQAEVSRFTTVDQLRRQLRGVEDLLSQRQLFLGSLDATAQRITEAAAAGIGVARASVWLLENQGGPAIRCVDLFEAGPSRHSSGTVLKATDFPAYFDALATERTIAAHDAHADPRTSVFSTPYLTPLGIGALLDVPIWVEGKMRGVLCHEHLGGARTWSRDDETFANVMGNVVALALERTP